MGMTKAPELCYFTGFKTENIKTAQDAIHYYIQIDSKKILLELNSGIKYWEENLEKLNKYRHISLGLLANGKEIFKSNNSFSNINQYISQLNEFVYPKSQKEKYDNLFLKILDIQDYDGQLISLQNFEKQYPFQKLFFKNEQEYDFYLQTLKGDGLIQIIENAYTDFDIRILFKGLDYAIKILSEGGNSKNCFIAMSFNKRMKETRVAIEEACSETGFDPIIMDNEHFESDKTINEAMLARLKSSKFCIIDFTSQRQNVYFEAGFAIGRGMKVIYCCKEDDFKNIHFDTRQFPHIKYKSATDLKSKLVDKINVWIKE